MAAQLLKDASRLMQAGDFESALARIEAAPGAAAAARLQLLKAQCLMALKRRTAAFAAARLAEQQAPHDAHVRDGAGTLYSFGHAHRAALVAYDAAISIDPRQAQYYYNRASVRRFLGDLDGAEEDYDRSIALRPRDFEAYKHRSDLRPQTQARNHLDALRRLVAQPLPDWRAEVHVRYALAKEYEDLGEYEKSFAELAQAAAMRRAHTRYDPGNDLATVAWIIEAFPDLPAPAPASSDESPIFVLGLPRSGTTLVERILDSHSAVQSAGELGCFALSLMAAVQTPAGARMPRRELVAAAANADFAALGRDYLQRAHEESGIAGRFIDKMPLNYLYCGLIRRALPRATLVHVVRHPMAVCYAMYKALFKDAYPFSYDLGEIARYYLGYRRLMAHWQSLLGDSLKSISYEALIADQNGQTQQLLAHCGLDWQLACAEFHRNPSASTTASAAQVRRPMYDSSLSQWRHYASQLAPLRAELEAHGIETG